MGRDRGKTRTIAIVATLDTRGEEVDFLRGIMEGRGHSVVTVDVGIMGTPHGQCDVTRDQVAEAGGKTL